MVLGDAAEVRFRLDREDPCDRVRAVTEAEAVAGPHLDDPTPEPGEQAVAVVVVALLSTATLSLACRRAKSGCRMSRFISWPSNRAVAGSLRTGTRPGAGVRTTPIGSPDLVRGGRPALEALGSGGLRWPQ